VALLIWVKLQARNRLWTNGASVGWCYTTRTSWSFWRSRTSVVYELSTLKESRRKKPLTTVCPFARPSIVWKRLTWIRRYSGCESAENLIVMVQNIGCQSINCNLTDHRTSITLVTSWHKNTHIAMSPGAPIENDPLHVVVGIFVWIAVVSRSAILRWMRKRYFQLWLRMKLDGGVVRDRTATMIGVGRSWQIATSLSPKIHWRYGWPSSRNGWPSSRYGWPSSSYLVPYPERRSNAGDSNTRQ